MKFKVYLAGKIRHCGWREAYNGYRNHSMHRYDYNSELVVDNELTIVGPFFISCDHGCYHGENTHGVEAIGYENYEDEWGGCMGDFYSRKDVLDICKFQIDKADIVFAYIDCGDCFGTLAEIGYAHAKGKTIVVQFANDKLKEDMWFIDKMQQRTLIVPHEWIFEKLVRPVHHYEAVVDAITENGNNYDKDLDSIPF